MAPASEKAAHEVVCPHCKKAFSPEPMSGSSARDRGFKCPHCRLFVASDRAEPPAPPDTAG